MKNTLALAALAAVLASAAVCAAAPVITPPAEGLPAVTKAVFPNGLTLLVLENHVSPTVSFKVFFRAGSADNVSGQTGLAHLFEHLVFKGTERIGTTDHAAETVLMTQADQTAAALNAETAKPQPDETAAQTLRRRLAAQEKEAARYTVRNEMQKIYADIGGYGLNAFTATDVTWYTVSLPSNRVEEWMIIESDRFKNPVLREFYTERDVVLEELRIGDSKPEGRLYRAVITAAFSASPYRNPNIGWESDVARLTRPLAEAYFSTYYGPNNATIVVAGDVNTSRVIELTGKYFASIEPRPLPARALTKEPARDGEHRHAVLFDAAPALRVAFNRPAMFHADAPALAVLAELLAGGRTARLFQDLVENKKLASAVSISAAWPGIREPGVFLFSASPLAPHTPAEVEAALYADLNRLKTEPVTARDLEKAVNRYRAGLINSMENNSGLATRIGMGESALGDWAFDWKMLKNIEQVTPQDIMRVASTYFTEANRSVAWIEKPAGQEAQP